MQSTKVLHVVFSSLFASKIAKEDCAPPGPLGLPGKCCALAQVMAYACRAPALLTGTLHMRLQGAEPQQQQNCALWDLACTVSV